MEPKLKYREMRDYKFAMITSMDELIRSNYEIAKALNQGKDTSFTCSFTEDELAMILEWASHEHYYTKKKNDEIQYSILDKVKKMLEDIE